MDAIAAYLAPNGTLRVAINLGNPVLAQGTADAPAGVTVDLAREIASRLGVDVRFSCFDAARDSFAATVTGATEVCFLAVDPARAGEITFTAPYLTIDGVFAVPTDSPLTSVADVDRPGVRIGVKQGSAYDLYLSRELVEATVVRGTDGVDAFRADDLEVAAGIRAPLAAYAAAQTDVRLIDEPFMQIAQAVGTRRDAPPQVDTFLRDLVEEAKASGFVAASLQRSGQTSATVAPPA